jgi:predicted amidohydrolase
MQMHVEPAGLERNLSHAEEMIAQAASGGARVAVLPEVMDLGWTDPSCRELAALQGSYGTDAEKILYVDVTTEPRPARGTGWADYWAKQK